MKKMMMECLKKKKMKKLKMKKKTRHLMMMAYDEV